MGDIKINEKLIFSQTGSDEPVLASNVAFPAGHVIQVITGSNSGKASSSSSSYTTLFTSPNITPSATTSNIIIMFHTIISQSDGGNGNAYIVIKRDGSTLIGSNPSYQQHLGSFGTLHDRYVTNYGGSSVFHDTSIATTSAVNYQIMASDDGSDVITVGGRHGDTAANVGVIWTLMEVTGI